MLNVALLLSHHSRQSVLFMPTKLKNHDEALTCWSTKHFDGMIYRTDHTPSV